MNGNNLFTSAGPASNYHEPVLESENLTIGYERKKREPYIVSENLRVSLLQGELACLVGPNGAGKSTLIRTITGLQPQISGAVSLKNRPLGDYDSKELAKSVSIVTTERVNLGMFTGYSLVALGRYPYTGWRGSLREEDIEAVHRAIKGVGAEELAARKVNELSDGERQKIMIARALAQEAEIMVLDEPTAFLDLPRRVEVMGLLFKLSRETGTAVLISTHDLDLALRMADRLWLISEKGKLTVGAPEDCVLSGSFEQTFAGGVVQFDKWHGSFHVQRPKREKVYLAGSGLTGYWTRRALEREGFEVDRREDSDAVVTVTCMENALRWKVETEEKSEYFDTIYDIIAYLRHLFHEGGTADG
jgi:iron complex transport system ATP-binding protein